VPGTWAGAGTLREKGKAGGRGILSHRLSEYLLFALAGFANLGGRDGAAGVQVAELAFDVGLQA